MIQISQISTYLKKRRCFFSPLKTPKKLKNSHLLAVKAVNEQNQKPNK